MVKKLNPYSPILILLLLNLLVACYLLEIKKSAMEDRSGMDSISKNSSYKGVQSYALRVMSALTELVDKPKSICHSVRYSDFISNQAYDKKLKQIFIPVITRGELSKSKDSLKDFGGYIFVDTYDQYQSRDELISDISSLNNDLVPNFMGIDSEGGSVQRFNWHRISSISEIKNYSDNDFCIAVERDLNELRDLGFNWSLAPVLDFSESSSDWIYYRTIDSSPSLVALNGSRYINCASRGKILTSAKHFPGHGGTEIDSHYDQPIIDYSFESWSNKESLPFKSAVENSVPTIMMGHLVYPDISDQVASLSPYWINEILRGQLSYKGLVVTDDLNMLLPKSAQECAQNINNALAAGNDLILLTQGGKCDWDDVAPFINIEENEIDLRLEKIYELKDQYLCEEWIPKISL